MRVVVTGAAGQLGRDVVDALRPTPSESTGERAPAPAHGDIEVTAFDRSSLDLTDSAAIDAVLRHAEPDVVINCAAYTAVDDCETNIELAHAVNEHGVRSLAEASAAVAAHLIHVSTDYVFDGMLDRAYVETDATNPQSVYGRSKLAGERAATDVLGEDATIVRTSWVCGEHGNNMVKLVRRLAPAGNPLEFVDDQRGCPTFTADLAAALRTLAVDRPGGVFHLSNAGVVSWYEFVREILSASGYDPDQVSPISSADLDPPRPAPRPANSVLANIAWAEAGYEPLRDFRRPLAELVATLDS